MSLQIPRRMVGRYYVWQTSTYGQEFLDGDAPADIYRIKAMPCTPAGDLMASYRTALEADLFLSAIEKMTDQEKEIAFEVSTRGRGDYSGA